MPRGKKCPECGKPYIHFDLHWNICPKNTEVTDNADTQDGSANAKPLRELASPSNSKSEDTSLDDTEAENWLLELLRDYSGMDFCGAEECLSWQACREFMAEVENHISQQRAKLFEQIRSEVIKDDKDIDFPENADNYWTYPKIRNRLRAEQLEALTRIESK